MDDYDVIVGETPLAPNDLYSPKGRRRLEDLYRQLQSSIDVPYSPEAKQALADVSRARTEQGQRNFLGGLMLAGKGGRSAEPIGRALAQEGITEGRPLRPNEADVGYIHPETGEFVEAPANIGRRREKALLAQIGLVEKGQAADATLEESRLRRAELNQRSEADRALRLLIAQGGWGAADRRAAERIGAADRRAAERAERGDEPSAGLQKEYLGNRAKLSQIERALIKVEENPDAVGAIGWLPEIVSQYVPGEAGKGGVHVRAAVSDLGSMKIHDRSGAAVSAMEFPRLRPFIPDVSKDSPDAIVQKLQQFKVEYEDMVKAIEQGYPLSKFLRRQGEATAERNTLGGGRGSPSAAPTGARRPSDVVTERKTLNGVNYVKRGGSWYKE